MPHQRVAGERELLEIHFDVAFLGDEGHLGETLPVLVVRGRLSRMTMASAAPSTGTFIAKRVVAFLREVGCEQEYSVVKSDRW